MGIVPHTHWDREWHVPFQAGRVRLVRILDAVLDDLESGRLACFWLDGQTAAVDDYLAVRPEAEERVRAVVASGRLGVGPWVVPMDEFVTSAETMVRNLEAGLRRRGELGAAGPAVGYAPDVFGHVAQLPQLLHLAGIDHAVVWRGVPKAIADVTTAFRWEAPDGSSVRAEYLYGSYANGRDLPADGRGLLDRARSWEEELGRRRVAGLLLMNGGDQRPPEAWVSGAAAAANSAGAGAGSVRDPGPHRYRFAVTGLPDWLEDERATVADEALPPWRGELRSAAGAPLLAGVVSNRVDVRAAAAAAERAVERRAEPLLALFRPVEEWEASAPILAVAWDRLIANSAHDSACACCSDPVADQVLVRYAEARQIGEALADQALADLAAECGADPGTLLVVNAGARTRSGVVEVTMPAGRDDAGDLVGPDGLARAVQVLGVRRDEVFAARVAGPKVGWVADRISASAFDGRPVRAWSFVPGPERRLLFEAAAFDEPPADLEEAGRALRALGGDGLPVTVSMEGPPERHLLVDAGPVPGFGWVLLRRAPPGQSGSEPPSPGVRVHATGLDNGAVRVEIDPHDGTWSLTTATGLRAGKLNRYVDGGDGGDTYTWCPPAVDRLVDRPTSVTVTVEEAGPLRGRVLITATYDWPLRAEGDHRSCTGRSEATAAAEIRTAVSLTAGDPVVAVETTLDNLWRDHRLRVHFPLPAPVAGSDAGCAFAVVHRELEAETGPAETPPPTFPARGFVDCTAGPAGLALLADGAFEYEVCDGGRELALTLLRATGWLSRRRLPLRPDPAGPAVAVAGAQVPGRHRWRYGVLLHGGNWEAAHLSRRAADFLNRLEAVAGTSCSPVAARAPAGRALQVEGAEVSSVLRQGGDLLVRLFHPGSQPAEARVGDRLIPLRPGQITTVRIARRPPPG